MVTSDNPLYTYPGDDTKRKLKRTILKTPNTPLAYRRVEGKYGLAYNAENVKELPRFQDGSLSRDLDEFLSEKFTGIDLEENNQFAQFVDQGDWGITVDVDGYLSWISSHPLDMPQSRVENATRSFLAREIMKIATQHNLGYVQETETYFMQYGVNFFNQPVTTLLIGGTIYHKYISGDPDLMDDLGLFAEGTSFNTNEWQVLRPNGQVLLDASYLVSIIGGLYGRIDPERALRLMHQKLLPLQSEGIVKDKVTVY